jgi:hypothetical protein
LGRSAKAAPAADIPAEVTNRPSIADSSVRIGREAEAKTAARRILALEHFERDRGLPVKEGLTPKVLHELAAQSGQAIE